MSGKCIVDIGLTLVFAAFALYAVVNVWDMPLQDRLFPTAAGVSVILAAVAYALTLWRGSADRQDDMELGAAEASSPFAREQIGSVAVPATAVLMLAAGTYIFGFFLAVPVFVFGYCLAKREKWVTAALAGSLMVLLIWGLLIQVMHVGLPRPIIANWVDLPWMF